MLEIVYIGQQTEICTSKSFFHELDYLHSFLAYEDNNKCDENFDQRRVISKITIRVYISCFQFGTRYVILTTARRLITHYFF